MATAAATSVNKADFGKLAMSTGLEKQDEFFKRVSAAYDGNAARSYRYYIDRLEKAKMQRNQPNRFLDDLDYLTDYVTNENAKNTYLRPKLNDSEVRVNTGTTEKKIETVYNELIGMNLQAEVRALDKNDLEISELGSDMGDLCTRTNQIECDEDLWQEAIIELLTQRAVYIQETFVNRTIKNGTETITRAEKRLLSGLKVFLGDYTIPAYRFQQQPYIVLYDRINIKQAESLFGDNPNFQHVKAYNAQRYEYLDGAFQYRFGVLADEEVEMIVYESVPDNEYQVILNGVMMYAPGTPLPWSYPGYDVDMFTLKSMSPDYALGRPLTASAKTLQGLSNEVIRLMIRKFQQSLEPPLAVPKGKVYSRDIWDPGSVTQGLKANEFERLIDHDGVNESEFKMYQLIEQKVEEFVGAGNLQQGLNPSGDSQTATEVLTLQKQALKNLGLAVAAIMRMKRNLTLMRIYTISDNYLNPTSQRYNPITDSLQDVYRSFTLSDAKLPNERFGTKMIQFAPRDMNSEEMTKVKKYEDDQAKIGRHVRVKVMNVNKMKDLIVQWYVVVNVQPADGTALDKVIFQDQLNQAALISKVSGRPLNGDVVIQAYEKKWKAKDWFQKQAPMQIDPNTGLPMQSGQMPGAAQEGSNQGVQNKANDIMGKIDALKGNDNSTGAQVARGLRTAPRPNANTLAIQ